MNEFFVYSFSGEGSLNPFYIGKGSGDRIQSHFRQGHLDRKTAMACKLRSILAAGKKPVIKIIAQNLTETEAFALEVKLIVQYGRRDLKTGCLMNHTDGGEGPSGHVMSDETRQKMSDSHKGLVRSFEHCLKMGAWQEGRKMPPEVVAKSVATRVARHGNPVESYNLKTGEIIKRYNYIRQVKQDGYNDGAVHSVIRGKSPHHRYIGWRYS